MAQQEKPHTRNVNDTEQETEHLSQDNNVLPDSSSSAGLGDSPGQVEENQQNDNDGTIHEARGDADIAQQLVNKLEARLEGLERTLIEKDANLVKLQLQVQQLRQDQIASLLSPPLKALARMLYQMEDATKKDYGELPAAEIISKQKQDFEYFAESLADAIYQLGFSRVQIEADEAFKARIHKAVGRISTQDEELDQKIAAEVSPGFIYNGASKVIIPASVTVYQYESEE